MSVASHRAVRRLFGQHLIKSGKLAAHLAQILAEEQDDRMLADYDVLFYPELDRVQQRVAETRSLSPRDQSFPGKPRTGTSRNVNFSPQPPLQSTFDEKGSPSEDRRLPMEEDQLFKV